MQLFREDALEAKRSGGWMGEVSLATPFSLYAAALAAAIVAGALVALVFMGHYTHREHASGYLLPVQDLGTISAPFAGVMEPIARSGQRILAGEVVMRLSGMPVRAPADGTLYEVRIGLGQSVQAGRVLAFFLPANRHIQAQLQVNQTAIGHLSRGKRIELRYPAFSQLRSGVHHAVVRSVSRVPRQGYPNLYWIYADVAESSISGPGSAPEVLLPGMRVEAEILLERHSLAGWAFLPLLTRSENR